MKNKSLLIWASDLSHNTGEGVLARTFLNEIQKVRKYQNIKIKTLEENINLKTINVNKIKFKEVNKKTIYHKYFGPIYGAIHLFFLSYKYKVIYINYLPLWNFIIFLILPGKTILGPITGGVYNGPINNLNLFIRKYFFPIFYSISKIIIHKKFKRIIFSTNILKKYEKKDNSYLFNFIEILFEKNLNAPKKKYDIIFYNRYHATKHSDNLKKIIVNLSKHCRICVIGDKFNQGTVINFGWVEREKALKLIQRSKLAINSAENFLSIFGIDCINNGTPIIYDKNLKPVLKYKNTNYIPTNFNNIKTTSYKILKLLRSIKEKKNLIWWNKIYLKKNRIRNYLLLNLFSNTDEFVDIK
jgi:hypothetical protein